jgi:hypothetical protein
MRPFGSKRNTGVWISAWELDRARAGRVTVVFEGRFRNPNSEITKGGEIGKPKIVCIGGGTGTYTALMGLKHYDVDLTAIVSMADNGGSFGLVRGTAMGRGVGPEWGDNNSVLFQPSQ